MCYFFITFFEEENDMNWRVKKILRMLSDNHWHDTTPKGIGEGTVNLCLDQGYIRLKRVNKSKKGGLESYNLAYKITRHGKKMIELEELQPLIDLGRVFVS